ncbi:hypothetical protein L210DRAFT_3588223 [Boletus edulis BED1]|uniref:Uncharacterized protein n=1 Tax=Boletus edulis BED1 TaxID=1328754 RepID=A0AAD4BA54_BOLED|nr:hypothetical protein L210DRAFT_3588223 [Boletus edulis BED1]
MHQTPSPPARHPPYWWRHPAVRNASLLHYVASSHPAARDASLHRLPSSRSL